LIIPNEKLELNDKLNNIFGKILVIAKSGRMLAQFLRDAGIEVVVIDCFADLDTRELAGDFIQVSSLALENIINPVKTLQSRHQLNYVIYGSGFERYCASVRFLESCLTVLGNDSVTFCALQDKIRFFKQLEILGIDYPEVSFFAPPDLSGWLTKPLQGEGGVGVSRYSSGQGALKQVYWQRYIDGESLSVLFVADKDKVSIVGFQRQLMRNGVSEQEFVFSGVISETDLPIDCCNLMIDWVTKLATSYQLKGLNSLDFVFRGQQCYVLEINARPTASLQLYDATVIIAHLTACLGKLDGITYHSAFVRAYKIVFAKSGLQIGRRMDWPDWAMDRSSAESIIGKDDPICSIIARGKSVQQVMDKLHFKQQKIEYFLQTGS